MHINKVFFPQTGHFFAKSVHYFLFSKKGRGDLTPPSVSFAPEITQFNKDFQEMLRRISEEATEN